MINVSSLLILCLIFWGRLLLNFISLIWLGWPVNELQGFSCLWIPAQVFQMYAIMSCILHRWSGSKFRPSRMFIRSFTSQAPAQRLEKHSNVRTKMSHLSLHSQTTVNLFSVGETGEEGNQVEYSVWCSRTASNSVKSVQ